MTKREVRILTISLLGIQEKDVVVDIGAGTGGLTMEAAYAANEGRVYAVEAKDAALELEKQNIEKFGAGNVTIIPGKAPAVLDEIKEKVDKVIIGGQLEAVLIWCKEHLNPGGRLAANFVTMENASLATTLMRKYFTDVDMIQVGVSRGEFIGGLTMLKASNPIFIITGSVE